MEIERKWLVNGWPEGMEASSIYTMQQGYISVRPTVRIREEALQGGDTHYVLCFKGAPSADGLSREEIETDVEQALFDRLRALIGKPLVAKEQRRYALPGGLWLEVNRVDRGQPGEFWYAEVEYPDEAAAHSWQAGALAAYLSREVTGEPGQSMGDYWLLTRGPVA